MFRFLHLFLGLAALALAASPATPLPAAASPALAVPDTGAVFTRAAYPPDARATGPGDLVLSAPGRGQGQVISLTGSEQRFFGPSASVWQSNGWAVVQGTRLHGNFAYTGSGVTLAGTLTAYVNASLDANSGGYTWGRVTYTDTATHMTCSGSVNGKITNALGTLAVVTYCRTGAMLVGHVQDFESYPKNTAPPQWIKGNFDGVLISPGGR